MESAKLAWSCTLVTYVLWDWAVLDVVNSDDNFIKQFPGHHFWTFQCEADDNNDNSSDDYENECKDRGDCDDDKVLNYDMLLILWKTFSFKYHEC